MNSNRFHSNPFLQNRSFSLILLTVFLSVAMIPEYSRSQTLSVTGVVFEDKGDTVEILYHLSGNPEKKYVVSLFLSYDGGRTFPLQPKGVTGDVGRHRVPGPDKKIVWRIAQDFPEGLRGENFVFAVEAELQKNPLRWPYYVAGAGIVGGLIVWGARRETPQEPVTGSVQIVIPVEVFKK